MHKYYKGIPAHEKHLQQLAKKFLSTYNIKTIKHMRIRDNLIKEIIIKGLEFLSYSMT